MKWNATLTALIFGGVLIAASPVDGNEHHQPRPGESQSHFDSRTSYSRAVGEWEKAREELRILQIRYSQRMRKVSKKKRDTDSQLQMLEQMIKDTQENIDYWMNEVRKYSIILNGKPLF